MFCILLAAVTWAAASSDNDEQPPAPKWSGIVAAEIAAETVTSRR